MKRYISFLFVCILIFIFNGCDSLVQDVGGGSNKTSSSMHGDTRSTTLSIGKGGDLKAISRFHTNIQAEGTFKPGESIQLSVSVRANLPTSGAEV